MTGAEARTEYRLTVEEVLSGCVSDPRRGLSSKKARARLERYGPNELEVEITGPDVSKEAADMVLTDDNFASIAAAVEKGRSIISIIQKFLRYLLFSNIGEILTMYFGVLLASVTGLREASKLVVRAVTRS